MAAFSARQSYNLLRHLPRFSGRQARSSQAARSATLTPDVHDNVVDFYSKLQKTTELENDVTIASSRKPESGPIANAWEHIHRIVIESFFGLQQPIPAHLEGLKILDVGSGAGRDSFIAGFLAGPKGHVVGVDATPKLVEKSASMIPYHSKEFGFHNVEFKCGLAEKLNQVKGLHKDFFDLIISNGVLCLVDFKDKRAAFQHIYNLLRPGGEFSVTDIYSVGEPLREEVIHDELVWNEGFGGAMQWTNFVKETQNIGFNGPYVLNSLPYTTQVEDFAQKVAGSEFKSTLCRFFKPDPVQCFHATTVTYKGGIPFSEKEFLFSQDITFTKDEENEVDEAIIQALQGSRFRKYFRFN